MRIKQVTIAIILLIMASAGVHYLASGGREPLAEGKVPMGKQAPSAENANGPIIGAWRSDDDQRFTREFRADGTITDRYEGDDSATVAGLWEFVDPAGENLSTSPDAFAGMKMIRATFPGSEVMHFAVTHITETSLQLINVDGRGNILSFTKDIR